MRVLIIATVQSHICQFHRPLADMLHANGYEIHVAARDNLAEKNGLKLDFVDKVFNVPFSRSPKSLDNIKAYKLLKEIIEGNEYNVIHCNTPVGGVLGRLAAKKARKKGTKVYYTAHGFHFYGGASKKNWLIYYPIEKIFANHYTDVLITINEEDYKLAKEKFKTDVKRIHGVGVDSNRYSPVQYDEKNRIRSELGYDEKETIGLCVGELLPNKNQEMLIRAVALLRDRNSFVRILIAGNGKNQEYLESLVKELDVEDRIVFLGYCINLETYQRLVDFSVSCSKREGLGLNIIEAMLSRKAVIGTVNRGHSELIKDGENGYLVKLNDIESLANCIVSIANNDALKQKMGDKGFEFAQQYVFESVVKELEEIYFGFSQKIDVTKKRIVNGFTVSINNSTVV